MMNDGCNGMMGSNDMNAPSARPHYMDSAGKMQTSNGWIFDVEPFYWQSHLDDAEVAVSNEAFTTGSSPTTASRFTDATYEHLKFKWDAGVKVGVGGYFDHDEWDVFVQWTHFHNNAHKNINNTLSSPTPATLFTTWSALEVDTLAGNLTAQGVDADWSLNLDLLDAELGRMFFAGKWLTVRPHVGLRGGWIRQKFNIDYLNLSGAGGTTTAITTEDINMKNKFTGLGVRAGVDTEWHSGCGWCLYGNGAVSILYGFYKNTQSETMGPDEFATPSTIILGTTDSFRDSKAITDLALGICYSPEISCMCPSTRFTISLGWEHHMFFNQFQLKRVATENPSATPGTNYTTYVREPSDLSTQGWTLGLMLDY